MKKLFQKSLEWLSRKTEADDKTRAETVVATHEAEELIMGIHLISSNPAAQIPKVETSAPHFVNEPLREDEPVLMVEFTAEVLHEAMADHLPQALSAEPIAQPIEETTKTEAATAQPAIKIKITLQKRGPIFYGTCTNCECTWNVSERVEMHSRGRTTLAPACPSCRKLVDLPSQADLRKLG